MKTHHLTFALTMRKKRQAASTAVSSTGTSPAADNKRKKVSGNHPAAATSPPYKLVAILSPAKTLNTSRDELFATPDQPLVWTQPSLIDTEQHRTIVRAMKSHATTTTSGDTTKLSKLLGISANLTQTARSYWQTFGTARKSNNDDDNEYVKKPCGFAFDGVVYQGLDTPSLLKDKHGKEVGNAKAAYPELDYLQSHLRIVDPVYGWLRPMDVMEPYRLEMATKNVLGSSNSNSKEKNVKLADYWKPAIRVRLLEEEAEACQHSQKKVLVIVNLASDEYSSAVDWPRHKIVKVIFRHGGRVLAVHAKRARGLMARYMALHQVERLVDIQKFDLEGYKFQPDQTSSVATTISDNEIGQEGSESLCLVFDRPVDWNISSKTKKSEK